MKQDSTPPTGHVRTSKRRRFSWLPWAFGIALIALGSSASAQSSFQQTPNPAAAGLWIGEVTLRAVTNPTTSTVEPTQSTAQLRLILHVDSSGQVRLLKDVIVAAKNTFPFEAVLVTKPSLLATLPVSRDLFSSVKGRRFSTVTYDFTDNDSDTTDAALNLTGGLGPNLECVGTLVLDKNHPTNPFRHKFNPDHANEGVHAYVITRKIKLQFITPIQNIAGVDHLNGTYEETIAGLHRAALTAQGTVSFSRAATTPVLNQ